MSSRTIIQKEGFFPSDGRWLFYRCWSTASKKGEILAIHGALEHSGRYEELGHELVNQGYNFYTFDFTGHGRSEGKRGYIYKFEEYIVDLANFYGFLRMYRSMGTPFLLGHSLGGLVATLFTAWGQCPVKGLILSAPLFQLKISISFWESIALNLLSLFYPTFYLLPRIDPKLLTHDIDIVEEYMADPLVQRYITTRWLTEIRRIMKEILYAAPYLKEPCLMLQGEEDKIIDIETNKRFFDRLGSSKKDFYIISGAYHEILNETMRNDIISKIIGWLKQTFHKKN